MNENIKQEIDELTELLIKYNDYYYNKNESLISDVEYDNLLKKLQELEEKYPRFKNKNSPTINVGSKITKNQKFKKVKHRVPMLSLSNSYNQKDIIDFVKRVKENINNEVLDFALELKLDGLSISVFYEEGKLKQAVTRGDGEIGEDVTENILTISSIPKELNEKIDIEIRGEVVMPLSSFKKLNEERMKNGEEIFANPRNAASGTLRQLDSNIVKNRGLDAYFYFLVNAKDYGFKYHDESLKFLEKLGIKTTGICEVLNSIEEIEKSIDKWQINRKEKDYETDGLVIKVNNLNYWEELGNTSKSPRWAIAYKFPAEQISTTLKDVIWQVGRTGKLTPVAELEEVFLSGSYIKRASLHNIYEIERKDIRIGDKVFIEKAAEIIPQVVKSIVELRDGKERKIIEPKFCPICNSELKRFEDEADIKCLNKHCRSKVIGYLEYFVSRDAMNIVGLGTKVLEKLVELNFISDVTDIYNLKEYRDELEDLEKMGTKSVDNLLNSIEESKNRTYDKVLYSLGIPQIGKVNAKILAKLTKNIDNLMSMKYEELVQVDGIGDIVAKEIINYFEDETNLNVIRKLKDIGLKFKLEVSDEENKISIFENKTFLITGTLKNYKRDEIKSEIENLGGKILNSVSKNLNYLIIGENPGSKVDKAKKIESVKIIDESEYISLKDYLTK